MNHIELIQSAREALNKRETVEIELKLKKLQESCIQITDNKLKFDFHVLIYRMLEFLKREPEALEVLKNALKYCQNGSQKRMILREMGLTYMRMNLLDKGFEHLEAYYTEANVTQTYNEIIDAALWLARFYYSKENYIQSLEYSNQAIYASQKENNLFAIAEGQLINGLILYKEGKKNLALDILREAEETAIDAHALALIQRIAISRCKIFMDKQNIEAVSMIINNLFKTIEPLSI